MSNYSEKDLWNNEMVRTALKSMTPEQVEEYKQIGEYMYKDMDFMATSDGKMIQELEPPFAEAVAYIEDAINSGLLPKDMEKRDLDVMIEVYGNEWYKRYDFGEDDFAEKDNSESELKTSKKNNLGENKK